MPYRTTDIIQPYIIKQVSLCKKAENVLEDTIRDNPKGDVIYFWAHLQVNRGSTPTTFWSVCDILNGGLCRYFYMSNMKACNIKQVWMNAWCMDDVI